MRIMEHKFRLDNVQVIDIESAIFKSYNNLSTGRLGSLGSGKSARSGLRPQERDTSEVCFVIFDRPCS